MPGHAPDTHLHTLYGPIATVFIEEREQQAGACVNMCKAVLGRAPSVDLFSCPTISVGRPDSYCNIFCRLNRFLQHVSVSHRIMVEHF